MSTTELIIGNPWSTEVNNNTNSNKPDGELKMNKKTHQIMEELFKIAGRELREDDSTRKQSLEQLRDWINKNGDLVNCLTDDNFLLRFLRVKKFSIPMAQQTLLKYLNFRKRFKATMYELDYTEPSVYKLLNSGYIFVSPYRDSHGRRVIIYDLSKFDLSVFTNKDMTKAHLITYETLLNDEENQILGFNHVADISNSSLAFLTLFSITEFATLIRWGEQSLPMRHKEIHLMNIPAAAKYVYDFAMSRLSPKLKERLKVHNSRADIVNFVDKSCLPEEFGGEVPTSKMIEMWKDEMAAKRERILSYDQICLLSDKGIITSKNPSKDETGIGGLSGSFRKLEVD